MTTALGQKVRGRATGSTIGYVFHSADGASGAMDPIEVPIPALGLAFVWWTLRSADSGDPYGEVTMTTISGDPTTFFGSPAKALEGFYSASGGGFVYSNAGGVYSFDLNFTGGAVQSATLWAIVLTDGFHDVNFGG